MHLTLAVNSGGELELLSASATPLTVLGQDLVVRIPVATYVGQVNSTLANHYRSPHLWIPPDPVCIYDKPQSGAQRESPFQGHHQFLTLLNHHTYTDSSKLTSRYQMVILRTFSQTYNHFTGKNTNCNQRKARFKLEWPC